MKLRESEEVLHELQPNQKILIIWFFTKVIWWSVIGGFVTFWLTGMIGAVVSIINETESPGPFSHMGLWSAVVFAAAFIASFFYAIFLRSTYRYYITTQRCVFVGGYYSLPRTVNSIP